MFTLRLPHLVSGYVVLTGCVVLAPVAASAQTHRFDEFLDASVRSPLFYLQAAGSGLIDQVSHFPIEWTGASGYGKRNLARLEQGFLAEAIGHGVAAALNHEVRYDACACEGALPRVSHAMSRVLVSRHVDGHLAPNVSRLAAAYGSSAIADFWFPDSYRKKDIFWQATTSLGVAAGLNLVREFIR